MWCRNESFHPSWPHPFLPMERMHLRSPVAHVPGLLMSSLRPTKGGVSRKVVVRGPIEI